MSNLLSIFESQVQSIKDEQTRKLDLAQQKRDLAINCLDIMAENLSFVESLGFTIYKRPNHTDSYGKSKPALMLYYGKEYFCCIEPPIEELKDENGKAYYLPSIEKAKTRIGANDLFRYGKPNACGLSNENFAKCLADILYKH